jgi:predicted AAA+ superfamily ATPase
MKIKKRLFEINLPPGKSAFLWGPRKVGKTYWITHNLGGAEIIDLLKTDVFAEYISRPALLRERYQDHRGLIVIDEVQKAPALLDEVHWLLPPHYLSPDPLEDLRAYVADYLKEEVVAEALAQNIPAFREFLRVAAITSSELINYVNIARETGVSHRVVRTYFDILEDTYLGFRIPPWKKSPNRRLIITEKFYLFDVGVANYLARRKPKIGSAEFGKAFEHYVLMELKAYQAYRNPDWPLTFWRTSTGREVDFLFGDKELAIEIKGSARVHEGDLGGLQALLADGPVRKCCIVCLEKQPRRLTPQIEVLPWSIFMERLWAGEFA